MKNKFAHWFVIGIFTILYVIVSLISTIHVIDFFKITNPLWLSISLAIGFELGAAASLASLTVIEKMNKSLIWVLFIVLTLFQVMGNVYYSYIHAENFQGWIELFGLIDESPIFQKRVLAIVSGAILPFVALGYIKALVDYIKPAKEKNNKNKNVDGFDKFFQSNSNDEVDNQNINDDIDSKADERTNESIITIKPILKNEKDSSTKLPETDKNQNIINNKQNFISDNKQNPQYIRTTKKIPKQ